MQRPGTVNKKKTDQLFKNTQKQKFLKIVF